MPTPRTYYPSVSPPPADVVQMTSYQYGEVMLIRPDGSYYKQAAASWQWLTNNANYLPRAATIDPRLPMACLSPSMLAQPWGVTHVQPITPGQPLPQWIGWQPVKGMPTPQALPAPRPGLLRRLLLGG